MPILTNYLKPEFTQNLILRQPEVDAILDHYVSEILKVDKKIETEKINFCIMIWIDFCFFYSQMVRFHPYELPKLSEKSQTNLRRRSGDWCFKDQGQSRPEMRFFLDKKNAKFFLKIFKFSIFWNFLFFSWNFPNVSNKTINNLKYESVPCLRSLV